MRMLTSCVCFLSGCSCCNFGLRLPRLCKPGGPVTHFRTIFPTFFPCYISTARWCECAAYSWVWLLIPPLAFPSRARNFNSTGDPCDYSCTPIWALISGYDVSEIRNRTVWSLWWLSRFRGPLPVAVRNRKRGVSSKIRFTPCPAPSMPYSCQGKSEKIVVKVIKNFK